MDFGLTAEQEQLVGSERAFLARHDPIARVRETLDAAPVAIDPAVLLHAAEGGLLALLTPDVGGTHVDLAALGEAHGYAASSLPLADLAITNWLLERAGMPEYSSAAEGDLVLGLARTSKWSPTKTSPVPMAADLAAIVVVDESAGTDRATVVRTPQLSALSTLDLTRTWARVDLDRTSIEWTDLPGGTVAYVRDALAVHRAFDALGAAARLLEISVTYAGQRQQFGVPIGSFQSVKHHCANMALGVEASRAALWAGAAALDHSVSAAARSRAASAAAAYAKSTASEAASTALQVHGGIGF
ncbi:MAG: acyl-CoA dehydrogenase family protein, partial [Mycobacterium sp.]